MEYFVAIALAALTGWLIANIGLLSIDRADGAFAVLIGGWRGDGWPRGVQEEDRDRPWGHPTAGSTSAEPPLPTPTLARIRPAVRRCR